MQTEKSEAASRVETPCDVAVECRPSTSDAVCQTVIEEFARGVVPVSDAEIQTDLDSLLVWHVGGRRLEPLLDVAQLSLLVAECRDGVFPMHDTQVSDSLCTFLDVRCLEIEAALANIVEDFTFDQLQGEFDVQWDDDEDGTGGFIEDPTASGVAPPPPLDEDLFSLVEFDFFDVVWRFLQMGLETGDDSEACAEGLTDSHFVEQLMSEFALCGEHLGSMINSGATLVLRTPSGSMGMSVSYVLVCILESLMSSLGWKRRRRRPPEA